MTSSAVERIVLILDCMPVRDFSLRTQPRLWRHRDGRYVTEEEAELIQAATPEDMRAAISLRIAEVEHIKERANLSDELNGLLIRHDRKGHESIRSVIARMPQPDRHRATEIYDQLWAEYRMWCAAGKPDWPG